MKLSVISLVVILIIFMIPITAKAADGLTHHLDLFQVAVEKDGQANIMDFGYHFTLVRFNRFQFVGAGAGLNMYKPPNPTWDCDCAFSPFLIIHLGSVSLASSRDNNDFMSFGSNWIYDTKQKNGSIAFGFSYSWKK